MKLANIIGGGLVVLTMANSCAKEVNTTSNEQSLAYIEAWVNKYYPDAQKTAKGAYILESIPSNGETYTDEEFVLVSYTTRSMSGTIESTTEENIAKQLGTYSESSYYGPKVWYTSESTITAGVEDALEGMRVGEKRCVLIPSWLMGTTRYKDNAEYIKHSVSNSSTTIYEITLTGKCDDMTKYQVGQIEDYISVHHPGLDSLSYGFYYKELKAPSDTTAFKADSSVYINYVGRLLNGLVFDTNIKDTAKKYNLYSSSRSYAPMQIKWADKAEELKMVTSSSSEGSTPVEGFQKLLWEMRPEGKSMGIFTSDLGYKINGSGNSIPGYAPLIFEVEITEK